MTKQTVYMYLSNLARKGGFGLQFLRQSAFQTHHCWRGLMTSPIKAVTIRTTFSHMINIAGIIYYTCSSFIDIHCTRYNNAFNKRFKRIVCEKNGKIYSEKILTGVCNAVYFRFCIDLIHITPPVTAGGFDGSHHPRYAECFTSRIQNSESGFP